MIRIPDMKKKLLIGLALLPFSAIGQVTLSLNGGYGIATGEHHSDYAGYLQDRTTYNSTKEPLFTFGLKAGYRLKHVYAGLGLDWGNYQARADVPITGIPAAVVSSSFVTATGRYLSPYAYAGFHAIIRRRFTIDAGLMAGLMFTGFDRDNGILMVQTPALGSFIPAQKVGVEAHTGRPGEKASRNMVYGVQLALGYQATRRLNANLEFAARRSAVDGNASFYGFGQSFTYDLWYFPIRAGVSYTFYKGSRQKGAEVDVRRPTE